MNITSGRTSLALALAIALLAPTSATQQVRGGTLTLDDQATLQSAGPDLRVDLNPVTGQVQRLAGEMHLVGADSAAKAADFIARYGAVFGATGAVRFGEARVTARHADGSARIVRMPQVIHGHELVGHGLVMRFDERARARLVHGATFRELSNVPAPLVGPADARAAAESRLARLGYAADTFVANPLMTATARVGESGVELLHRADVVIDARHLPLAVEVSADTGTVRRVFEVKSDGIGNVVWDDTTFEFLTGKGKGSAYKSIKNAEKRKAGGAPMNALQVQDAVLGVAEDGMLAGRYASVFDDNGIFLISGVHNFVMDDESLDLLGGVIFEYEVFDHVNTYYWLTRMGQFMQKLMGDMGADTQLPAVMNFDDGGLGYANAFFSPSDLDGPGGYDPGYFVFGDFDNLTGDVMDDMSRDPTIVCHEYVHAVVSLDGHGFGDGDLDTPSRAVNEAIADYGASTLLKTPEVGPVFMAHSAADLFLDGDALRHLESPRTMQDNLWDETGFSTGLPEEHVAGEIFGAALWRARTALKNKTMDPTVFGALADWPQSNAEAGYPTVTVGNASDAYRDFYYQCFAAMMDDLMVNGGKKGPKNALKMIGAFLAHGIAGATPETIWEFSGPGLEKGLSGLCKSEFLGSIDEHAFDIELVAGQLINISVLGDKKDATQVGFAFDNGPGDFIETLAPVVHPLGTKVTQNKIEVVNGGVYRLTINNPGGEGGRYKLKLKLKVK